MIYNNSYFNEQLKKTYIEGKKGDIALVFCVVIIALVTLVVHNIFYTLSETIVGEVAPHLTSYSIFAMISVYNVVIIIFFVSLCIIKYKRITIAEISTNKWYLLIKTGHSPIKLVFSKLVANVLSVVFIYSLTFILLILLGSLLELKMNINAIFSLAMTGLIQVFFVVELIMSISIFVEKRGNCLFFTLLGIIFMAVLSSITNFDVVAKSVLKMEETSYLFSKSTSIYIYILLAISFAMLFLGGIKGHLLATSYKPKAQLGKNVYSVNYSNNHTKFVKYRAKSKSSLFKVVTQVVLVIVVFSSILANMGMILLATMSKPNASIGNHIMLIFESTTMTGEITKNDFVVFRRTNTNESYEVGDVILYYKNQKPVVQMVERDNGDGTYLVDYIKYPYGTEENSNSKTLEAYEISGAMISKSGWIGAFLLWNKTILAKILTTVVPTLILIFYDKLEKIFKFVKSTAGTDESDDLVSVHENELINYKHNDK